MKYILTGIFGIFAYFIFLACTAVFRKQVTEKAEYSPKQSKNWSVNYINNLNPSQFDALCNACFEFEGYRTIIYETGPNQGVNIVISNENYYREKPRGVLLTRHWQKKVGLKAVNELKQFKENYHVDLAVLATQKKFTSGAYDFAQIHDLTLLSSQELFELITSLSSITQKRLMNETQKLRYHAPLCPTCGEKMTLKRSKQRHKKGRLYWRCYNFPVCVGRKKVFLPKPEPRRVPLIR